MKNLTQSQAPVPLDSQRQARRSLTLAQAGRALLEEARRWQAPALLICDVSGSMDRRDAGRGRRRIDALREVLLSLQGEFPGTQVLAFSSQPQVSGPALPEPSGGTALHLALAYARSLITPETRVCLISDGEPDDPALALEEARNFPVPLQVFYAGPEGGEGAAFLARLAALTGGRFGRASLADTPALVERISALLTAGPGA